MIRHPLPYRVFLGWDPSEATAWLVARNSLLDTTLSNHLDVARIDMTALRTKHLYWRPTEYRTVGYYDVISEAPMATGHAIARFLVPYLCGYRGWALFCDGDVLFREDIGSLHALADPSHAVSVVQHSHVPTSVVKMEGHLQTRYHRKNWSSVMLFNCAHPAHQALAPELVNTVPGRDLHRFCWLRDDEIGALPPRWNHLVGVTPPNPHAAIVHFTNGLPNMPGHERCEHSEEWHDYALSVGGMTSVPAVEGVQ